MDFSKPRSPYIDPKSTSSPTSASNCWYLSGPSEWKAVTVCNLLMMALFLAMDISPNTHDMALLPAVGHDFTRLRSGSLSVRSFSSSLKVVEEIVPKDESSVYKWRLHVSYDGCKYAGWQMQQECVTVQLMLEEALKRITKLDRECLMLIGASRTDAGVHAWDQVAQFQTPFHIEDLQTFHSSINGLLPTDIRVREIASVPSQFHARYSARGKIYHYKVYCSPIMDPFQLRYALHVRESLNIHVMREAARYMVGEHDFQAFANASKKVMKGGYVRNIYRLGITEKEQNLVFEVEGSGFLYKQVRNMIGLLLEIGKELLPPSAVQTILASQCRKLLAYHAPTAPPNGLHLMRVIYDEADLNPPSNLPYSSCGIFQTHSKCKVLLSNMSQ